MVQQSGFYASFSRYYDEIFPLSSSVLDFVLASSVKADYSHSNNRLPDESRSRAKPSRILDIGCGTGSLVLALADRGSRVTGIDLNREMVALANEKRKSAGSPALSDFAIMDMLDISVNFPGESMDMVLCLGNTIAHLPGKSQISSFFNSIAKILKPGGIFILQSLNYDYILDNMITKLPVIKNGRTTFYREYSHAETPGRLLFNTRLTVNNETIFTESTPHNPIRGTSFKKFIANSGLLMDGTFGGYDHSSLEPGRLPAVYVCSKRIGN